MPLDTRRSASSFRGLLILLLAAGAVAIGVFLIRPKVGQWMEQKPKLAGLQSDLTARKEAWDKMQRLVAAFKSKKSDLEVLKEVLPDSPSVPQLLANLESIVASSGLKVVAISVTEEEKPDDKQQDPKNQKNQSSQLGLKDAELVNLKISLKAQGLYEDFVKLLANLESSRRLYELENIASEEVKNDKGGTNSFLIVMTAKYLKSLKK